MIDGVSNPIVVGDPRNFVTLRIGFLQHAWVWRVPSNLYVGVIMLSGRGVLVSRRMMSLRLVGEEVVDALGCWLDSTVPFPLAACHWAHRSHFVLHALQLRLRTSTILGLLMVISAVI